MITLNNNGQEKKSKIIPIIVGIIATIIISLIAVVYYWTIVESYPQVFKDYFLPKDLQVDLNSNESKKVNELIKDLPEPENKEKENITNVIKYSFPADIPDQVKVGTCSAGSLAQPYRQDAYKCAVGSIVYDPCFASQDRKSVICHMNPLSEDKFVINLSSALPEQKISVVKENWAWFVELEDGTICSPYTTNKPLINNEEAFYGCKAKVKGDLDVLIKDLIIGEIWTAKRMIVTKDPSAGSGQAGWDTKFSEIVKIKTIWQ